MHARERPLVLLVAEAVTLAHFARISVLAHALDAERYRVVVATDPRYAQLAGPAAYARQSIHSISSAEFNEALARGKPLYDAETLSGYVEDDLALIRRVKPDLIVGDFRLSLAVSAPLAGVPYAAIVNAYWSPYADIRFPVPDLPLTRAVGVPLAQRIFDWVRPLTFRRHARALDEVRRRYGLAPLDGDLRTAYSWGDFTLYADVPGYVPMRALPANHEYLGVPLWSTQVPLPAWWSTLSRDTPRVFVTLGSSGATSLAPRAVETLSRFPCTVIVATAGRHSISPTWNVRVADYVPIDVVARDCSLLVCNGGSLTTYQAASLGVPVVGICTNMDQLLNMNAVERLGAGVMFRSERFDAARFAAVVDSLLHDRSCQAGAALLGKRVANASAAQAFRDFVAKALA